MLNAISVLTININDTQKTFCSSFTTLNNHETPFRLLLLVLYNNNEIQEQNHIKNIESSLYSLKYPLWVSRVCRAHLRFKAPRAHHLTSQQWQAIGNLC